jgi:outer membrane protein assembly factor BamB
MRAARSRLVLFLLTLWIGFVGADRPAVLAQSAVERLTPTRTAQIPATSRGSTVRRADGATASDWPQFDLDARHSGDSTQETVISAANVGSLDQLFQVTLPAIADGTPVYLSQVSATSGLEDLLFVTTKAGDVVALDAHTGTQVWAHSNPAGSCRINIGSTPCYTTSSPAIDPNRQLVYSYGLDGYVHKYAVGTGSEVFGGGWPELATRKDFNEKGSSALSVVTARNGQSYLYVTNGGYPGDQGDYQGHVTAINLATGTQNVFNALCSDQTAHFVETPGTPDCPNVQSAVWARSGTIYDATLDRILLATGNGPFSPSARDWGDTVFSLNPDGTSASGNPLDSYTPSDYQTLADQDLDLGSTAPAIIPVPTNCNVPRVAAQAGKDGILRLLDLDNLSGQGGPGHVGGEVATMNVPQGGEVLTQPATWTNPADGSSWVFVANDSGIAGLRFVAGNVNGSLAPSLQTMWLNQGMGGTSPIVANNVLYLASNGAMRALSPTTGGQLWQATIGNIHWESPIVVNGVLYVPDESSQLTAFAPTATLGTAQETGGVTILLPVVANGVTLGC